MACSAGPPSWPAPPLLPPPSPLTFRRRWPPSPGGVAAAGVEFLSVVAQVPYPLLLPLNKELFTQTMTFLQVKNKLEL